MATLHLLGTGAAVSDPHRTTTMLAVENATSLVVIDCGGDAVQRLMTVGANLDKLSAVIVTHEHADHVSGFPLLMEKLWLLGRRDPVPVYGIAPAISQTRRIHDSFDTSSWQDYPGVDWREFAYEDNANVFSDSSWEIVASPGVHSVPVVGLRFSDKQGGGSLVYSCDTETSTAIERLANGVDLLVHEATGEGPGHSSAQQAAGVAKRAGVKRLLLVHLPPEEQLSAKDIEAARQLFEPCEKGKEAESYTF